TAIAGFFATMVSRMSWNACSARKSEEPPISRTRGGFPFSISERIAGSGLGKLGEQSLFLQLLTVDAERRPWHGEEALFADDGAAVGADGVRSFAHAVEGFLDGHEQVALGVGEGEVELLGVGAGGFVGEVLDAVVGESVAGGLVALVRVEQLALFEAKQILVRLVRIRFDFCFCHSILYLWYAMLRINVHAR